MCLMTMKPEIGYSEMVMASYIDDLLNEVKLNMKQTKLSDPYFEQLSVEKFTLETLLQKIIEHSDYTTSIDILEQFAQEANEHAYESRDPHCSYVFEVARDAAMSILDGLYFGY